MTDKVQKIREAVENRYEYWREKEFKSHSIESEIRMSECKHLLLMLNSIQEEPVSKVWHDVEENPDENRDFAFVDYDGVMWSRYRIEDLFHGWQSYVNMTGMAKWAYTSDLIKL